MREREGIVSIVITTPSGWKQIAGFLSNLQANELYKIDMTQLLDKLVRLGLRIQAIPYAGDWGEIDSPSNLKAYEYK
jgi:NDP-sugar pyrophosphorylase family protein